MRFNGGVPISSACGAPIRKVKSIAEPLIIVTRMPQPFVQTIAVLFGVLVLLYLWVRSGALVGHVAGSPFVPPVTIATPSDLLKYWMMQKFVQPAVLPPTKRG